MDTNMPCGACVLAVAPSCFTHSQVSDKCETALSQYSDMNFDVSDNCTDLVASGKFNVPFLNNTKKEFAIFFRHQFHIHRVQGNFLWIYQKVLSDRAGDNSVPQLNRRL